MRGASDGASESGAVAGGGLEPVWAVVNALMGAVLLGVGSSRRRRAPVSASYRRLARGKYSRALLVALRVRGRRVAVGSGAGSARRGASAATDGPGPSGDGALEDDARGGAVPAEANARRNAEDASVISALPAASMTNARPSARRMITKGLGSGGCSARGMGGQASAGEGRSGETGNGRAEGNEQITLASGERARRGRARTAAWRHAPRSLRRSPRG